MQNAQENWRLKMFFDGACPFCLREANFLKNRDKERKILFVDTSQADFDRSIFGGEVNKVIHGMLPDGTVIKGVEVFRQAYKHIGLGWLLAPTGWPILKPIFDRCYLVFAKYRIPLGRIFGRRCDNNSCV